MGPRNCCSSKLKLNGASSGWKAGPIRFRACESPPCDQRSGFASEARRVGALARVDGAQHSEFGILQLLRHAMQGLAGAPAKPLSRASGELGLCGLPNRVRDRIPHNGESAFRRRYLTGSRFGSANRETLGSTYRAAI